jgi:hypothetical protein
LNNNGGSRLCETASTCHSSYWTLSLDMLEAGNRDSTSCTSPGVPKSKAQFSGAGGRRTYMNLMALPFQ